MNTVNVILIEYDLQTLFQNKFHPILFSFSLMQLLFLQVFCINNFTSYKGGHTPPTQTPTITSREYNSCFIFLWLLYAGNLKNCIGVADLQKTTRTG